MQWNDKLYRYKRNCFGLLMMTAFTILTRSKILWFLFLFHVFSHIYIKFLLYLYNYRFTAFSLFILKILFLSENILFDRVMLIFTYQLHINIHVDYVYESLCLIIRLNSFLNFIIVLVKWTWKCIDGRVGMI
jgi:hypothetical protein